MAENSGIAWTTHTFNPWIGCTKVGPGCDACYAEVWDRRFDAEHVARHWGPSAPRRRTKPQNWSTVARWQRERRAAIDRGEAPEPVRVFCASLADVFDNEVDPAWRADLWALIAACPDLYWILVTKRVGNVAKMAPVGGFGSNVIILSSIVNQPEADRDADKLVAMKRAGIAKHIGISYEPALGFVNWSRWLPRQGGPIYDAAGGIMDVMDEETGIDWLIVGAESDQGGATGRDFQIDWAMSSITQCRAAGVAVFVKQLGRWPLGLDARWAVAPLRDRAGADPDEWPKDLHVREFPRFMRVA